MEEKYKALLEKDRFATTNGIELLESKPGYAKAMVKVSPEHLNAAGVVHGGLLFTLADFAFAAAANAYGSVALSVATSMSYFDKSTEGIIYAEAKELARSNKLINCDVDILHESGTKLANFKGTAYVTKQQIG